MADHRALRGNSLHEPTNTYVENNTGTTISKWHVVDLNGMGSIFPQIIIGNPSLLPNFGITQSDILTGQAGWITCLGFMYGVNTSAWAQGTVLYSSPLGVLQNTINGQPVAMVIKQDVTYGVLYVTADLANQSVANLNWQLSGNADTNPATEFIGTTDNNSLNIRTNNQFVAKFSENGRFGLGETSPDEIFNLKGHTGMPGSGHRQTTYTLTTSDTNWNTAYSFTLPTKSVMQITASSVGYNTTTLTRCSFKQTATLWRETSIAVLASQAQNDYTFKSANGYHMRIKTLSNQVIVEIQAHSSELTKWTGSIDFDLTLDT